VSAAAAIRFTPKTNLTINNLHVKDISFGKESVDGSPLLESGIINGTVTILSTGEKVSLAPTSRLRIEGATGVITRLDVGENGLSLLFEGTVTSASTGPDGFARELKPSLLEYLYHQQRLGFFWAAASFLWGLLWSARTLIFK
jgi:hypothetical protein